MRQPAATDIADILSSSGPISRAPAAATRANRGLNHHRRSHGWRSYIMIIISIVIVGLHKLHNLTGKPINGYVGLRLYVCVCARARPECERVEKELVHWVQLSLRLLILISSLLASCVCRHCTVRACCTHERMRTTSTRIKPRRPHAESFDAPLMRLGIVG